MIPDHNLEFNPRYFTYRLVPDTPIVPPTWNWNIKSKWPRQSRMYHYDCSGKKNTTDAQCIRWSPKTMLHPGKLTWNLQITHLERKMMPPWFWSTLIFRGVVAIPPFSNLRLIVACHLGLLGAHVTAPVGRARPGGFPRLSGSMWVTWQLTYSNRVRKSKKNRENENDMKYQKGFGTVQESHFKKIVIFYGIPSVQGIPYWVPGIWCFS